MGYLIDGWFIKDRKSSVTVHERVRAASQKKGNTFRTCHPKESQKGQRMEHINQSKYRKRVMGKTTSSFTQFTYLVHHHFDY